VSDPERLDQIIADLEIAVEHKRYGGKIMFFEPYAKQREFLNLGATKRERLLMAGNRLGKSEAGSFEAALHLTGEYPKWWKGRRFDQPTKGWIAGVTSIDVRNVCQTKLCGQYGVASAFGTGMIPRDAFVDKPSLARGVTDAYDTIQVRHKSGGVSIAQFKSYEQGRAKFQGEGLDWIWFDEEPPLDIYGEGLTRIGERDGIAWLTFTPLEGRSAVVIRFLDEPSPDREVTTITIDEAPHITPEVKVRMLSGYLAHELEARARGVPMLGSGRIFTTPEASIIEPTMTAAQVPSFWRKLWGIDFGIGHPFGAVLILWEEPDGADIIHIFHAFRMADTLPMVHAAPIRKIGGEVPVAYPKDGDDREKGSGEPLSKLYRAEKLKMLHEFARWEDGGVSTDAGITEWDIRERTGRLKVAAHLGDWLEERRFYHRKEGKIVKIKDDLMSATRVALMMKRFAKPVPLGGAVASQLSDPWHGFARGTAGHPDGDFDLFTGGPS
jgi:phage terminase large subunit-like protein